MSTPHWNAVTGRSTQRTRDEAYADVSKILNENTPYIWMYRVTWAIAATDEIHGFGASANGTMQTVGTKTWIADLWRN